ncbi:MAG: hypothetical protein WC755_05605 [Candidatus Woesearchaeota archaeon]|jgi:hypothetical protein
MTELIKRLQGLEKPKQFADWLWKSLEEFYLLKDTTEESIINQKSPLYLFITKHNNLESTVVGIAKIYDENIPKKSQTSFRQSIGITLHKSTKIKDNKIFNVIDDLIYLTIQTKAVEALDGLLEVNSNKYIASQNIILYDTLACVQSLVPNNKVFEFTRKLVEVPSFEDGYIFVAIAIMLECKPDNYKEIINNYKQRIQKLYASCAKSEGNKEKEAYFEVVDSSFAKHPDAKNMILSLSKV